MPAKNQYLEINVILSNRTKQGKIQLFIDKEEITQWDIPKAKEIHKMLGEAIEAAVSDTFIWHFMTKIVGADESHAAKILLEFRKFRQGSKETVFLQ